MNEPKAYKMTPATASDPVAKFTPTESKSDKFIRLANHRTNQILKYLDALGNLTNKNVYAYTPEQVTKIIEAIDLAVNTSEKKLLGLETYKQQFKL